MLVSSPHADENQFGLAPPRSPASEATPRAVRPDEA